MPRSRKGIDKKEITIPFKPRKYQWEVFQKLKRFNVIVCHRRFGKTCLAIWKLVAAAVEKDNARLAYIAPTYRQGKAVAFDYLKEYTEPLMQLGGSRNETELKIDLYNGSRIQIFGADNPDALRGLGFDGVVMDEFALMSPRTWTEIIRPAVSDKLGFVIFIGTPMGHNQFWEVFDFAKRTDSKDWYGCMYRSSDTNVIPDWELEDAKRTMPDSQFEQEYECSFNAAVQGSYYGALMEQAEKQKRIGDIPYDPTVDVETWWDLGIGDSTAIWFAQRVNNEVRLIDYYETNGESLAYYVSKLNEKPYNYGAHIAPHDIVTRELGTGKSRLEVAAELGLNFEVAPKLEVEHGIESVRNTLPNCWFDRIRCKQGIEALKQYKKVFDDKNQVFKNKPHHNWASHGSDAFRYGCVGEAPERTDWAKDINVDTRYII
jgi:phage terminase large subunit|tara:strand:- start:2043 stop:3335 length:1293 start_codon:yes stop_codon:yes gene_type:complete